MRLFLRKRFTLPLVAAAVLILGFVLVLRIGSEEKEIHIHAGFRVYVDNQLQDYSDSRYMDVEPCTTPGHKAKEDDQLEKAHLHDNVGWVVHVHREGAVWGDLFKNIRVAFLSAEPVVGYEDGKTIPNILTKPIEKYESVVIVVGDQTRAQEYAKNAVTLDEIKQVEAKSETCGGTS